MIYLLILFLLNLNINYAQKKDFIINKEQDNIYEIGRFYDIFIENNLASKFGKIFTSHTEKKLTTQEKIKKNNNFNLKESFENSPTTRTRILAF